MAWRVLACFQNYGFNVVEVSSEEKARWLFNDACNMAEAAFIYDPDSQLIDYWSERAMELENELTQAKKGGR
jgi:hypothetical protein